MVMSGVRALLDVDVPTAQLFSTPTIAGLGEALARFAASKGGLAAIPLAGYTADQLATGVPCSLSQEQMIALHRMQPDSVAYNVHDAMSLHGDVDEAVLEAALAALARRHASLRTHFVERDGTVLQAVLPAGDPRATVRLQRCSLPAGLDADQRALQAELARLIAQPYALIGGGVPLRIYLLAAGEARVLLLSAPCDQVTHPRPTVPALSLLVDIAEGRDANMCWSASISAFAACFLRPDKPCSTECRGGWCSDGWSMGVLYRELAAMYNALRRGGPAAELPALPIQYADYSAWQRVRIGSSELDAQRAYWRQQLADAPPLLELPTDFSRPAVFSGRGASVPVAVPAALAKGLRALAASCGATTFMALLAVWQVAGPLAGRLCMPGCLQCRHVFLCLSTQSNPGACCAAGAAQPVQPHQGRGVGHSFCQPQQA